VLGGLPVGEVAERYGTTRQSLHAWRKRFEVEGMPGLTDRSRRLKTTPSQVDAGIEALICGFAVSTRAGEPAGSALSSASAGSPHCPAALPSTGCWPATAW
jgi:hypothetical protein